MGYQPKIPCISARDEEDADRIRNELKEEYNFYIRVQRILMTNKRSWRLILQVNEIIQNLSDMYDHISIPPSIRQKTSFL
jgi:flagellin-specific chaperone FliS